MKLEPELIKEILLWCEGHLPDDEKMWSASDIEIKGFESKQIQFHTKLLFDNGYIDGESANTLTSKDIDLNHLTMSGYQYLELLRGKAWKTAKGIMYKVGVIFAEGAIKAIIDKTVTQM